MCRASTRQCRRGWPKNALNATKRRSSLRCLASRAEEGGAEEEANRRVQQQRSFLVLGAPCSMVITLFVLYIVKLFFVLLLGVQRCFFIADTPYRQKPRKLVRLASENSRVLSFQNSNPYTRRTIRGDGASCTPEAISYFAYRVCREETICLKQLRTRIAPNRICPGYSLRCCFRHASR